MKPRRAWNPGWPAAAAFIILALLTACARQESPSSTGTPAGSPVAATLTVTATAAPTATSAPTATPQPAPILPAIDDAQQTLTEEGVLTFAGVTIPEAGWLVIFADDDGQPGAVLGHAALEPVENADVTVTIEAREATPTLFARLHADRGTLGEFEYPGLDAPLPQSAGRPEISFTVDIDMPMPYIAADDQIIGTDGLVRIAAVFALEPGWLVVHSLHNGVIGPPLGQTPVSAGLTEDLAFPFRWRDGTTQLVAVLHQDAERPGGFEPSIDLPVLVRAESVSDEFEVTLPVDVLAYDQAVVNGRIVIERVISKGPGWIVAYYEEEGVPGLIIGFALVEDGVNELVEIDIVESAVTPQLFLIMHNDTGELGEFEFPAGDLPVLREGQPLPPFVMRTDPGNYLITQDQSLGNQNSVTVPLVVTDLDTWLVLYIRDDQGERGRIVGQAWLPAGINRDVTIDVDPGVAGETLLAALHQDSDTPAQLDFPDGNDVLLLRNRLPIQSPFSVLPPRNGSGGLP